MPRPVRSAQLDLPEASRLIDETRTGSGEIRIVVDSRIRIRRSELPTGIEDELRALFVHKNPDYERAKRLAKGGGRRFGPMPDETIETWRLEDRDGADIRIRGERRPSGQITFPRGGLRRVLDLLVERGLRSIVVDERSDGAEHLLLDACKLIRRADVTLMAHQLEMIAAAERVETCVIRAPTGTGKTWAGLGTAARLALPTLVLVPSEIIFDQWIRDAPIVLDIDPEDIGVLRGSTRRVRPLTIATVQTFAKIAAQYADTFGTVIFDEVQLAAAATFYAAVDPLKACYRIGISADERRKDRKEFLVYDAFGDVALDVKREPLVAAGVIVGTEIRLVPTTFEAPWYVELPDVEKASPEAFDRLLREMQADEERNELAASLALEDMRDGRSTLVFVHRVDHAFMLLGRIAREDPRTGSCVGEQPKERKVTIDGMRSGVLKCAVGTYRSIGTGVDLPAAERGVCVTPIHTNRPFVGQVRGRVGRKDRSIGATKIGSVLHYLWDVKVHGATPLRNLLRWNAGDVKVLVAGAWEDGRAHLKRLEAERDAEEEPEEDLFAGAR